MRFVQPAKALLPISVTLAGMVTLVMVVLSFNASSPTFVTGQLLIVLGRMTVLSVPVYFVMVTVFGGGQETDDPDHPRRE